MTFISIQFVLFLIIALIVFYISPVRFRWIVLLIASMAFYFIADKEALFILLITIVISFFMAIAVYRFVNKESRYSRLILAVSIVMVLLPLFAVKEGNFILSGFKLNEINFIVPLGISFYTLQIISYFVDVYRKEIVPEKNIFRYALYISYFPQIIQGPIPRFAQMEEQLKVKKALDEKTFIKGFQLILWGCFLKLMIADKAGVIVDTVFNNPDMYKGVYVLVAGTLYSIQLYTDFMACVCIAKGVSELFGISLADNFNHPYFSQSISEFWRRWHISLSSWLKDYIYIPLGGNRKGNLRRYVNLVIVFVVSGMWHGSGYKYIFWGLMHAGYSIIGSVTKPARNKIYGALKLKENDWAVKIFRTAFTFICVMFAWIIFRADSLRGGIDMLISVFTTYNPWVLFDDSLLSLGLGWKEWVVLLASIIILVMTSLNQKKYCIRDKILEQNVVTRGLIYLAVIMLIVVFGTYGYGFEAGDFIYGGF